MDDARLSGLLERGEITRLTPIEHEQVLALVTIVEDPSTGVTGGPTLVRRDADEPDHRVRTPSQSEHPFQAIVNAHSNR